MPLSPPVLSPSAESEQARWRMLGSILFGILLAAGIGTTSLSLVNNRRMLYLEWLFMLAYLAIMRSCPPFGRLIREHRIAAACLLLWALSLSISLWVSPYRAVHSSAVAWRYAETLTHVLFAIVAWDFLRRAGTAPARLIAPIPLATFYIAVVFVLAWYGWYGEVYSDPHQGRFWMRFPPLNSHMRVTGYQVTAGLATMLAWLAHGINRRHRPTIWITGLSSAALWGFIFWLGGRGAWMATAAAVGLIAVILRHHERPVTPFLIAVLAGALVGIVLSEWLAVFPWNGLFPSLRRTAARISDVDRLSSGRLRLWLATLEQVRANPWFGLGPNATRFIQGRGYTVQSHCLLIQFLAEWGLAGTIPFLIVLAYAIRGVLSRLLNQALMAPAGYMIAGVLICALTVLGLVDGPYYHGQSSLYLALAFGMTLSATPAQT